MSHVSTSERAQFPVIFPPEGAAPYRRDLPKVETHLLDTGHFALEAHGEEMACRIEGFLLQLKKDGSHR